VAVKTNGFIQGLEAQFDQPIRYRIQLDSEYLPLEIGRQLDVQFLQEKACIHCGRRVRKLYQNGYCFPCVQALAECDLCIVKPHECHFHEGTCRDEAWGREHCMTPHYVYLAFSSDVKVGLTRRGRELVRWMEQGAQQAMIIAEVPTRKLAGELEMEIARNLPDKTNWRKMLTHDGSPMDLKSARQQVIAALPEQWLTFVFADPTVEHHFLFPREAGFTPELKSLSLDKRTSLAGVIRGIKGQYLLLDDGVFNLRKHTGYRVQISIS